MEAEEQRPARESPTSASLPVVILAPVTCPHRDPVPILNGKMVECLGGEDGVLEFSKWMNCGGRK